MSFDLTAAENIGLCDVSRIGDRPAIEATAERAGVNLTVKRLPNGYDTMLTRYFSPDDLIDGGTPSGVPLSGGQWQRLAPARAFMRADRDLLILDEPSAGLDAGAEHEVHGRRPVMPRSFARRPVGESQPAGHPPAGDYQGVST
ncbi:hypothetical protein [Actinoplanes xinjiangensis]|uniref:hypothetical protein n=1 Tax=Actinoplanes xinjiangensis TaxID=512350 RepID=UPI00342952CF